MTDKPDRTEVVYDDTCRLCVTSARLGAVLDRDRGIDFVPASSERGRQLLEAADVSPGDPESFVLVQDGGSSLRSDAAIGVMRRLPLLRWLAPVVERVPVAVRDATYDAVARNRYRLVGRIDPH